MTVHDARDIKRSTLGRYDQGDSFINNPDDLDGLHMVSADRFINGLIQFTDGDKSLVVNRRYDVLYSDAGSYRIEIAEDYNEDYSTMVEMWVHNAIRGQDQFKIEIESLGFVHGDWVIKVHDNQMHTEDRASTVRIMQIMDSEGNVLIDGF